MQPNNMQAQPAMAPNQMPQQSPMNYQTTPVPPTAKKASPLGMILAIVFGVIALGLIIFIVIDKMKPQDKPVDTHVMTAPLSTRLSEIDIPKGSEADILKNTLAGRTFTVNSAFDEYITFTSESKYEFSYYRSPVEDRLKLQASTDPGTYTVNDKAITLSNGESFQITGDYLVKTSDKMSNNKTTVYFDALQLDSIMPNISVALSTYLNTNKKADAPNFEKVRIERFYCHADYSIKKMTNADSYLCDTTYSYLFDQSKLATQIKAAKAANFPAYCALKKSPYSTYVADGGTCNPDYTVSTWSYVIVRTDNISYRVTGSFRTIEDSTEALPRY
ncbi:hypothetical protein J6X15_04255 [Candidatus Saccharibacteria bacterium]|nr:hypothetical protein [Candidatus Saccharibacteria bacterium]MBP5656766.1 hypothetical protein [Candidatus Saccharibacteria bacterium]